MPWCPTRIDAATNKISSFVVCKDEEYIAYKEGGEGQYCAVPFLMNERFGFMF